MQPPEPDPVPAQPPPLPPAPPPATAPPLTGSPPAKPRNRRLRLFLALGAGILALLCLGTAGVIVSLYDEATEIKRTAPDAVADSYLRAYLVNRNDDEASLYRCGSGGDFAQIEAFRAAIESTEKQYTLGIRVTWTTFDVTTTDARATATTDVVRTLSDNSERDSKRWQLQLVDQDGWRVCGATEIP